MPRPLSIDKVLKIKRPEAYLFSYFDRNRGIVLMNTRVRNDTHYVDAKMLEIPAEFYDFLGKKSITGDEMIAKWNEYRATHANQ